MARTRILIANSDLKMLSKIYLTLLHKNYKTEASNEPDELLERIKRFKPSILILDGECFQLLSKRNKIPVIIVSSSTDGMDVPEDEEIIVLHQPVSMEILLQAIKKLEL